MKTNQLDVTNTKQHKDSTHLVKFEERLTTGICVILRELLYFCRVRCQELQAILGIVQFQEHSTESWVHNFARSAPSFLDVGHFTEQMRCECKPMITVVSRTHQRVYPANNAAATTDTKICSVGEVCNQARGLRQSTCASGLLVS